MPNHRNVYISLATSMSKTGKFQLTPLVIRKKFTRKTKELKKTIASIATADHFWVILRWLYRQCNVDFTMFFFPVYFVFESPLQWYSSLIVSHRELWFLRGKTNYPVEKIFSFTFTYVNTWPFQTLIDCDFRSGFRRGEGF